MQQSTTVAVAVKPIVVTLAFAWGFEDGAQGRSEYEGYSYFVGYLLTEYRKGHQAGKAAVLRKQMKEAVEMPAEFVGALADVAAGLTYTTPGTDWAAVEDSYLGD